MSDERNGSSKVSPPGLQRVRAAVAGKVPPPPIAELLGIEFDSADEGRCTMFLNAMAKRHSNPMGTLHGGVLCDLGDAAMGFAVATTLQEAESFTTLELKINFFKPIRDDRLHAVADVLRRTRSLAYVECVITDSKGSLVAKLASTCMILRGEAAKGR